MENYSKKVDKSTEVWYNCFGEVIYYIDSGETIRVCDREVYLSRLLTAIEVHKVKLENSVQTGESSIVQARQKLTSLLAQKLDRSYYDYLGGSLNGP